MEIGDTYSWFHENGSFSVHSVNEYYLKKHMVRDVLLVYMNVCMCVQWKAAS